MAVVDYFLKIEGIEGESSDDKHKNEIEVESWSWGESNVSSMHNGGLSAGKVSMQDFHFVMKVNKASPKLINACATGTHIKAATLVCRKAGKTPQEFLVVKFGDLLVSSYQTGGSGHGDIVPTDQISITYSKIEYNYSPQKADGSLDKAITVTYDLKLNKA